MSTDKADKAIEALTARISSLEERVTDLTAQLVAARRGSMLHEHRCPACGGGEFLHVTKATQATDMQLLPLALVHLMTWRGLKTHGVFEYYVCRSCLLVETHATNLTGIIPDGTGIVEVSAPPAGDPPAEGPYR